MNKYIIPLAVVASLGLSSCYFNSAGHLFDKAGYSAKAKSEDAKPGQYVYTDGSKYYVELPRYRVGKPIKTQYSVGKKDDRQEKVRATGGTDVFEIPADFAMYLTGQRKSPSTPSAMTRVEKDIITTTATIKLPIVFPGGASSVDYKYSSGAAAWWYTAGIFDWLCVDLPITCVENSLATVGILCMAYLEMGSTESSSPTISTDPDQLQANLESVRSTANQRGYMTVEEAQYAARCIKDLEQAAENELAKANQTYENADTYAGLSNYNTGQYLIRHSVRNNARAQARHAQEVRDATDAWTAWFNAMSSSGRIR